MYRNVQKYESENSKFKDKKWKPSALKTEEESQSQESEQEMMPK